MAVAPGSVAAQRADIRFKIRLAKVAILVGCMGLAMSVLLFVSANDVASRVFACAVATIFLLAIAMSVVGSKKQRKRADKLGTAR